jgi:endonuclease/exonuclease/phosphatase family metal-dependent hydrolase
MITILAGFKHVNQLFPINILNKKISGKNTISILSYNVRLFNLYEWNANKNARTDIFNFLKKSGSDIICLQEYFSKDDDSLSNTSELAKMLDQNYLQIDYVKNNNKIYNFGIATYSSYPIVNKGVIKFNNTWNTGIYSDIKINSDTIRVYNFHLASVHLGYNDYYFIDNFETRTDEERVKGFRQIIIKLKKAFMKRAVQVDLITEYIKKSPYPVIVCGDFNDTPVSYTYHKISQPLDDAFVESGFGFGNTFTNSYPFFRIDYILHSKTIKSKDFQLHDLDYSDHFPISCKIVLE